MKLWYTYYINGYDGSDNVESFDYLSKEQEAAYHAAVEAGEDPEVALASFLDEIREGIIEQEKENFADWGEEWDDAYEVVLTDLQWKQ